MTATTEGWYIVHVHHDGHGHGEESDVILITQDITQAIRTARKIEEYGFSLKGECYASVSLLNPDVVYAQHANDKPVVYFWSHYAGSWSEQWLKDDQRSVFETTDRLADDTTIKDALAYAKRESFKYASKHYLGNINMVCDMRGINTLGEFSRFNKTTLVNSIDQDALRMMAVLLREAHLPYSHIINV